jgi:hypothetical protein
VDLGAPEDALQGGRCPLKCKGTFGDGGHLQEGAIPANGGYRRPVEAARLKGLGMRPGVPDVVAIHRGQSNSCVRAARATDAQRQAIEDLRAAGGHAKICHDLNHALAALEGWGLQAWNR